MIVAISGNMKLSVAFSLILTFGGFVYQTNGLCNTCSAITGLACVDTNKFRICLDGIPQSKVIECPTGLVCTSNEHVCAPTTSASAPNPCGTCGLCIGDNMFVCTDYNTFSFCTGVGIRSYDPSVIYTCPNGFVCSIDSATICVNSNTTGIGGTCPWKDLSEPTTTVPTATDPPIIVTTTPNAQTSPNVYCTYKALQGRFEVPQDTSCQTFISCSGVNGLWTGNLYECPKTTYFNATSQRCGGQKPSHCI